MQIAIDLGTANILAYVVGQGIVLNEPSVVAFTPEDGALVAVGEEARQMFGRNPGSINVTRPMQSGAVADYATTQAMLRYVIQKVGGGFRLSKPEVMASIPAGVTGIELRAVHDATLGAGAGRVYLIPEPLAAALGADLPISTPSGNMVVDIGGGTFEAAVISMNDIVVHSSVRAAGNRLDELIMGYVKKRHNLLIGERTAEEVKIEIGSALPLDTPMKMEVRGRDQISALPTAATVDSGGITDSISGVLQTMVANVKTVLEQTPPELAADIAERGAVLTGGGALLRGLDRLLSGATGIPFSVAKEPMSCVAVGAGKALENFHVFRDSLAKI